MPSDITGSLFDIEPPATLYKYLSRENFERFISSKSLRISQPSALNDMFEMRARAQGMFGRAQSLRFAELIEKKITDFFSSDEFIVFLLRIAYASQRQEIDLTHIIQLRRRMRMPTLRHQMNEQISKCVNIEDIKTNIWRLADFLTVPPNLLHRRDDFGVLCLSQEPLNQPMWAHYGDLGRGVVVGLDTKGSRFVRPPAAAGTEKAYLAQVRYDNKVTESFFDNWSSIFIVKNSDWSYEKEWRCIFKIENLIDSGKFDSNNSRVFLQSFIESDIVEFLYGYNLSASEIADLSKRSRNAFPAASHKFIHSEFIEGLSAMPLDLDDLG